MDAKIDGIEISTSVKLFIKASTRLCSIIFSCGGTDSSLNLTKEVVHRITVWEEMRFGDQFFRRGGGGCFQCKHHQTIIASILGVEDKQPVVEAFPAT